jgi:hypothetical protein
MDDNMTRSCGGDQNNHHDDVNGIKVIDNDDEQSMTMHTKDGVTVTRILRYNLLHIYDLLFPFTPP